MCRLPSNSPRDPALGKYRLCGPLDASGVRAVLVEIVVSVDGATLQVSGDLEEAKKQALAQCANVARQITLLREWGSSGTSPYHHQFFFEPNPHLQ